MADDDISLLLKSLAKLNSNVTQDTSKERIEDHTNVDQPPRKSRIYLKNVECLREPNRQPIEQTENQLSGNNKNNNNSSEVQNQNFKPPKQKISIKSVDVLREPALLMRDYERENVHFSFYIGDSNEITTLNIPVTPNTYGEFNPSGDGMLVNTTNKSDHQKNIVDDNVDCNAADVLEKPRKPKIYVKSVESFNLMPVQSSNTEYISDHSNVLSSYMYESNTISTNETNNNLTFINDNHTENMDTNYHVINNNSNPNVGNYSIMENPIYVSNINGEDINCGGQLENVTLITEPTPPPPPHISLNVEEVVHFTVGVLYFKYWQFFNYITFLVG